MICNEQEKLITIREVLDYCYKEEIKVSARLLNILRRSSIIFMRDFLRSEGDGLGKVAKKEAESVFDSYLNSCDSTKNILLTITVQDVQEIIRQELNNFFAENKKLFLPEAPAKNEEDKPVGSLEIARFLNISHPTLVHWRDKGRIPHIRIGRKILYVKSDVMNALRQKKGMTSADQS